jgi:quinol-cytochrome oxidoreductase complex cytochrome b subunit
MQFDKKCDLIARLYQRSKSIINGKHTQMVKTILLFNKKRFAIDIILVGFIFICLAMWAALHPNQIGLAAGDDPPGIPTPTGSEMNPDGATPTPLIDPRAEKPVIPDNPSLADKGSIEYWSICMACHGDAGQGLTDEWRKIGFGEDMNCWQSKCHANNHPPQGFEFPRFVPAVIGPNTLRRFTTAAELHDYLLAKMPWWKPGSLSNDQAWELTAFLLRQNGVLPGDVELDISAAASIPVHVPIHSQEDERAGQIVLLGSIGLAAFLLLGGNIVNRIRSRPNDSTNQIDTVPAATPPGPQSETTAPKREPREQVGRSEARPSFFHHLHPPTIPLPQARWRYTLGAGGMAVFLSIVLGITGALEMFFYIPTPDKAGMSIQTIQFLVPFGSLVRGLHFWSAQALVVVAVIHLLRVIFTGAYAQPRRFNYLLGLVLLVLILFLDFTGYVLRWDEGIRWALLVGTNLLKTIPWAGEQVYAFVIGGVKPGLATLTRFYAWHIFGLTLIIVIFIAWHIFRVRRDGGIAAPPPEFRRDTRRITRFELVRREVLAMLLASIVLVIVATFISPPLAPPIQETGILPIQDVRAPWFFLWIQQLLRYGNAFWLGVALPLGLLAVLVALPYLFPRMPEEQRGRWFPAAGRAAQIIAALVILAWLTLTVLELLQPILNKPKF